MKMRGLIILILLFMPGLLVADDYHPTELFAIEWGDGPNQLKLQGPAYEDINDTPDDPTDDIIEVDAYGPTQGFVDLAENVYFDSYDFGQFKAFDSQGNLFLDLSRGTTGYNNEYFESATSGYAVDSQGLIYFTSFPAHAYIAVVDRNGNLVEKLYPCGIDDPVGVDGVFYNYDDVMAFSCGSRGIRTYFDGSFEIGGGPWRGVDGIYYVVRRIEPGLLEFKKIGDPDSTGWGAWREIENIEYPGGVASAAFMGVDINLKLYVLISDLQGVNKILVYNNDYSLDTEFELPDYDNQYYFYMGYFLRQDGNIYHFRCLDDGLHVIRWSRE